MKIESSTYPSTTPSQAPSPGLKGTSDEFLKLFMAQLQHQDPLNPNTGADMVAELAQMTAVEQTRKTNQQLEELAAAQSSVASAGLTSLIGHEAEAATGAFTYTGDGAVPPIEVSSSAPMTGAAIVITDANGKEIRRLPVTPGTTRASLQWDGKDSSGNPVKPGSYEITVEDGVSKAPIEAHWNGRVDAVELTPDGPRLRMGGMLVAPATIASIGGLADRPNDVIPSQGV